MLNENQRLREPENLCDAVSTLGFILHFYCSEFALLLTDLCIDLVLLTITLCSQFCVRIIEMLAAAAEGFRSWAFEDDGEEEEADCDPIRVPAALLWGGAALIMDVALDLPWLGFGGVLSPLQALVAAIFVIPLFILLAEYFTPEEMVGPWHAPYAHHRFRQGAASLTWERERGLD